MPQCRRPFSCRAHHSVLMVQYGDAAEYIQTIHIDYNISGMENKTKRLGTSNDSITSDIPSIVSLHS